MELEILKPFGPSILKVKIPKKIIDELNNYTDEIILNKTKSKELNYGEGLVGDVTQEFKIETDIAKKSGWLDFLGQCVFEYVKLASNKKITKFNLIESWIVRQFKNEYNPVHWHNGHISGAGFLKVPEELGTFKQDKGEKDYTGGNLNLIYGTKQFLSPSLYRIKPKVGDFYFFPNYLMHTVYPFKGTDEERRSISFNGLIDSNIYHVYGK
tara:strand:- start:265 stop:897 length:633 start_codon:yes stop_codon:yes gene_type:complete